MSKSNKDPCKTNACKIQACLKANDYQESACCDVLEEMRQCCLKWHQVSICCSGIKLDKNYLETEANQTDKKSPIVYN